MNKKYKFAFFILILFGATILATLFIRSHNIAVLNPKGMIAREERDLMITATLLMLIVVIPVFVLTIFIAWKYRAGNTKARYTPDWDHHPVAEFTWWAIPTVIIIGLALVTWRSSHELDPFKPLSSTNPPMTIQVVAMQWKWLFIYPRQNIASVNYVQFPVGTPINFEITSDAPMNSFWIPQLGGQIYAMSGMSTRLHLVADTPGSYNGSSANISGEGFAGMKFVAKASSSADFDAWAGQMQASPKLLSLTEYNKLSEPSKNNPPSYYVLAEQNLYDELILKYMMPDINIGSSGTPDPHDMDRP